MFIISDIAIVIWLIYLTIKISRMRNDNTASIKRIGGVKKDGDELSRKILDWVIKSPEGLSKNGLRDCFHRHVSSSELNDRLLGLERSGLIKSEIIPTKGRSKTVFKAANFNDV